MPPAATEIHPGLGDYHFPITTANADAQVYFDQGIRLLYGFNHDEAARYFRRAAELDPQSPMPYWGLALAIGPNYNDTAVEAARAQATYDAVKNAEQRAQNGNSRERDYVAALAKRYPTPVPAADWLGFHREYSLAMRDMVAKYPDDLDAATMFAESLMMLRPWQLWSLEGEPAPGTLELVAVLESVLKRNPNHPGANHFYIHAVEASRNLERAIPSSMRLMTLTPGAGHLVHMPGHIFLQTGRFRSRRGSERHRIRGRPRLHRAHGRDGRLPADVLDAQHSFHRVRARPAGALRGREASGQRHGRQRRRRGPRDANARGLSSVSADGRSSGSIAGTRFSRRRSRSARVC